MRRRTSDNPWTDMVAFGDAGITNRDGDSQDGCVQLYCSVEALPMPGVLGLQAGTLESVRLDSLYLRGIH